MTDRLRIDDKIRQDFKKSLSMLMRDNGLPKGDISESQLETGMYLLADRIIENNLGSHEVDLKPSLKYELYTDIREIQERRALELPILSKSKQKKGLEREIENKTYLIKRNQEELESNTELVSNPKVSLGINAGKISKCRGLDLTHEILREAQEKIMQTYVQDVISALNLEIEQKNNDLLAKTESYKRQKCIAEKNLEKVCLDSRNLDQEIEPFLYTKRVNLSDPLLIASRILKIAQSYGKGRNPVSSKIPQMQRFGLYDIVASARGAGNNFIKYADKVLRETLSQESLTIDEFCDVARLTKEGLTGLSRSDVDRLEKRDILKWFEIKAAGEHARLYDSGNLFFSGSPSEGNWQDCCGVAHENISRMNRLLGLHTEGIATCPYRIRGYPNLTEIRRLYQNRNMEFILEKRPEDEV